MSSSLTLPEPTDPARQRDEDTRYYRQVLHELIEVVAAGRADLVALARPHLANPYFTLHAAAQYGVGVLPCPPQYAPGKQQLFRVEEQARREIEELRRKAKPKVQVAPLARAAE